MVLGGKKQLKRATISPLPFLHLREQVQQAKQAKQVKIRGQRSKHNSANMFYFSFFIFQIMSLCFYNIRTTEPGDEWRGQCLASSP